MRVQLPPIASCRLATDYIRRKRSMVCDFVVGRENSYLSVGNRNKGGYMVSENKKRKAKTAICITEAINVTAK